MGNKSKQRIRRDGKPMKKENHKGWEANINRESEGRGNKSKQRIRREGKQIKTENQKGRGNKSKQRIRRREGKSKQIIKM